MKTLPNSGNPGPNRPAVLSIMNGAGMVEVGSVGFDRGEALMRAGGAGGRARRCGAATRVMLAALTGLALLVGGCIGSDDGGGQQPPGARQPGPALGPAKADGGLRCGQRVVGDYDGDGLSDTAVSAPGKDVGEWPNYREDLGQVAELQGTPNGLRAREIWTPGMRGVPDEGQQRFGQQLIDGDFDGDGCADLAIAALDQVTLLYGEPGIGLSAGRARVLDTDVLGLRPWFNSCGDWDDGGACRGRFAGLSKAGDVNGDGTDDLLLTVAWFRKNGSPGQSGVAVVPGSRSGVQPLQTKLLQVGKPPMPDHPPGLTTKIVGLETGDANADGISDIAVGLADAGADPPGPPDNADPRQHVYVGVVYGNRRGIHRADHGGAGTSGRSHTRVWDHASRGVPGSDEPTLKTSLAFGDLNGDGYDDLAIGDPDHADQTGRVTVIFGDRSGLRAGPQAAQSARTYRPDRRGVAGPASNGRWGSDVAAGDVTGDGYDDLVVSATYSALGERRNGQDTGAQTISVLPGAENGPRAGGSRAWSQDSPGVPGEAEPEDLWGMNVGIGWFRGERQADLLVTAPGEGDTGGAVLFTGDAERMLARRAHPITQRVAELSEEAEGDDFGQDLSR